MLGGLSSLSCGFLFIGFRWVREIVFRYWSCVDFGKSDLCSGPADFGSANFRVNIAAASLVHSCPLVILPVWFLSVMIRFLGFLELHCHFIKSEPARRRLYVCWLAE